MIVVLDNRDSFVFNLARHFQLLGVEVLVLPSHTTTAADLARLLPAAVVISPGPCTPDDAGISLEVIRQLAGVVPILGVCLGHQSIGQVFGGKVVRAPRVMHGKTSKIFHDDRGLFAGVSLQGTVMAIRSESIRNYYGRDFSARQLVIEMAANNQGAGPLREILTRYGARAVAPPANMTQSPGYAPAQPPVSGGQLMAPPPNAPVQSQPLPPPRR